MTGKMKKTLYFIFLCILFILLTTCASASILPEDRLRVTDGWCTSKRMLAGDVGDCVGCYHPGGSIGECRQCRYFYADRKGLQIKLQKEAKEAVNADGIYLMQMIELVRKSLGYEEDIASALLRIRGSADRYANLLARKVKEQ